MKKKLKAIVLGGTSAHIQLIDKLKKRGYYIILIDYYKKPIAKSFADEHIQESTLDKERILEIAKQRKVDLVITTCVDQANVTAVYVSEKLGLHTPYGYETALDVTNKARMKKKMLNNGIPTAKFILINDIDNYNTENLRYPLVVKPSDANGSKGVNKVENLEKLHEKVKEAFEISRSKEVIVEEYKKGTEIGVDCFVKDFKTEILTMRERRKITTNSCNSIQQIVGTLAPADINKKSESKLQEIANKIATVFKLKDTPLMMQVIINNDEINVIEFAPRIGGGESAKLIEKMTNFDIIDEAINSFLGKSINLDFNEPECYFAETLIYAEAGKFGEIKGYQDLVEEGFIEYLVQYKTKGMEIGPDISSINRVGAFAVKSNSKDLLYKKIKKVINIIEVYDVEGKSIMRKEFYRLVNEV